MFSSRAIIPASSSIVYRRRGFTLIELLSVIAIIGILAGITFGVIKGVNERSAISHSRTELAVLSQALESYKRQYGDYPQTSDSAELLQSLIGRLGPKGDLMVGKVFLETAKFTLSAEEDPVANPTLTLVDPWGMVYRYYYKNPASPGTWTNPGYVLFSSGPDAKTKASDPTSAGVVDYGHADNLDNLYANR